MKKYFQVMNSNPNVNKGKVKIDGRDLKFHRKTNTFYTHDEGLAREIEAENPKYGFAKATVVEVPQRSLSFAVPDLSNIKGMSHKHE